MKNFTTIAASAAIVACTTVTGRASMLSLGGVVTNISSPYTPGGTPYLVASATNSFDSGPVGGHDFAGTITSWVVGADTANPLGGLTFVYQVSLSSDYLYEIQLGGYTGNVSLVNVADTAGPLSLLPGSLGGGTVPTTADWVGQLHFTFGTTVNPPGNTYLLVVDTSATTWGTANSSLYDDLSVNVATLSPVPEPTTASLLVLAFGATVARTLRRMR